MIILGTITGDSAVLLTMRSRSIRVREELRKEVRVQGLKLLRLAKEKVSGPVLKNRTGTLRRKINNQYTESADEVMGSTGIKLAYGRAHELGFDGPVTVREHIRQVKMAWGRPIAPVDAVVHSFTRHMKLPARSYLRSSLAERATDIRAGLGAAVQRGVA